MMEQRTLFTLLLTLISFQISLGQMVQGGDTLVGNEWINYGQRYYKFSVDQDGIYRISSAVLEASGITGDLAIGANFRLYNMGRQVPIYVSNNSLFGTDDYIEFYGYKNRSELDQYLFLRPAKDMLHPDQSLYTDQNIYYLAVEGDDIPLRVNSLINDLANPPAQEGSYLYREALHFIEAFNDPYFPSSGGGAVSYSSYMHGEGFSKGAETHSTTQIPALNRTPGADALLHLRFTTTNYGPHSYLVLLNDQLLDTVFARDIQITDTAYVIPSSLLTDDNQLKLTSLNVQSRHSLVSIELYYQRTTVLAPSTKASIFLHGKPGSQHYVFEGFPHQGMAPIIYSYDGQSRMITSINAGNNIEFVWPETLTDTRIEITDATAGIQSITQLEQKVFTDYSDDNTEYIIITHPSLMEIGTNSQYMQYRSSPEGGSYRTKAYSILDLYDQFGYGIDKHPQAIRNFVEFFHRHWPDAKMIFIVGRGIEYNKSRYAGTGWENYFFVPTFGRPGSDQLLTATLWDLVPRYPIGRLAVTQSNEIGPYLDKVKEYDVAQFSDQSIETKAWIKNVMHIGGGKEAQEQNDFKIALAELGDSLAHSDFGAKVSFFQKQSTDPIGESQSKQVEKLLNEGCTIINYLGHSSANTFEFNINDPNEWNNKGRYPIFSAMGCSAGQIHGLLPSLSDQYVLLPNEGAIAFISGSGSQFAPALLQWAPPWYEFIGGAGYEGTLGESILYGLKEVGKYVNPQLTSINIFRFLLEQQTFQGDPALRFHPFPGPDYLVDRTSVSISPEVLSTKVDSIDVSFSIANIGRNLGQSVGYMIQIKAPDGRETTVKQDQIESQTYETTVHARLPLSAEGKPGSYRLLITLDPAHLIDELPAPQAEDNNQLTDNLGVIGIPFFVVDNVISAVYPPDFGIVNTGAPVLIATSSNSFLKSQDFVLEIDTTALFNSPLKIREHFPDHGATLKWSPQLNFEPDRVYYWRVSTDSLSPEQKFLWSRRSFLFKPGSPNGWNQSHFHQLTDNTLDQLRPDSLIHHFKFANTFSNFRILNRYQNAAQGEIPFGYIDGIFYTEFFSKFTGSNINAFVVAIDPVTGEFMTNPNPGLYGSFNNLTFDTRCFAYRTDTPADRQAMINFIENIIPDNFLVFLYTYQRPGVADYFPEQWESDEVVYGKSIFSVVEDNYPTSAIRSLAVTGSVPYIVFFQKGKGGIEEVIAADTSEVISLSYDIPKSLSLGTHISRLVGPASHWSKILWEPNDMTPDSAGQDIFSARAISANLLDTLLISDNIIEAETDISSIDAKAYPYIELAFTTQDSITFHPTDIVYWRVLYDGYPEFIINPDVGYEYYADTLFEGDLMRLSTYVENVTDYDVDSLDVSLRIIGKDNSTVELKDRISPMNAHSDAPVSFQKLTDEMSGDYQLVMEINKDHLVNELNYSNNIGILPLYVKADRLNPVLDVTFDGVHILDGDLVSANPFIVIQLHDENQFLRLDDTSTFELFLKYPSEFEPHRISFSESWVNFIEASGSGENKASVELSPELPEDGIYELHVKAKDASGNIAGNNDYFISFEVITKESISYLYNYPNPFSTSTKFVYTLTGKESPPFYKIQIMSVSGRIVREITQEELGPLTVGTHMTDFTWDGTDEYGGKLAAGTYLYRMVVKNDELEDVDHYETSGDETFFKKGWGKLVILR